MVSMRYRSKKQLPEMTRPSSHTAMASNAASTSDTSMNPPISQGGTHSIPSSNTGEVITLVGLTNPAHVSPRSHNGVTTTAPISQAIPAIGNASTQGFWHPGAMSHRTMPYGMPSSLMQGLHTNPSTFSESLNVSLPQLFDPGVSVPIRTAQQSLTNASFVTLRQQMETAIMKWSIK